MSGDWKIQQVPLYFRIGELTLLRCRFTLMVCTRSFNELREEGTTPGKPDVDLPKGAAGYLYRSLPIKERLPRLRFLKGFIAYAPSQYERYFADLSLGAEEYLKTFSSKSRSTLKRKVRKFAEHCGGEMRWKEYATPDELKGFYPLARSISIKTYQERLLDSGLPSGDEFMQRMVELAGCNEVKGFILFHEDKPIAYLYTPIHDGVARYEYVGFDPEYSRWSPGVVLQWLVLEKFFVDPGISLFDFLEGETQHKSFFATGSLACADVFLMKMGVRNFLLVMGHLFLDRLSFGVGALLERLGLKSRIRKMIRSMGRRSSDSG
ncbi:MAG: GNAT family N-acetyltransferase [Planctomycetota bacterium]